METFFEILVSYIVGYVVFWAVSCRRQRIGLASKNTIFKYLGYDDYGQMRHHVIGKNFFWAPVVGAISIALVVREGIHDFPWAVSLPLGYGSALWRFFSRPRSAWDGEGSPDRST